MYRNGGPKMLTCHALPIGQAAGLLVALVLVVGGQTGVDGSTLDQIAKSLAENVLGRGSVTSVRTAADATMVMRWEAATLRPQVPMTVSRELLYAEAELVTGAVLASLREVRRITFTIVRGPTVLASGEARRFHDVVVRFVPELGGGAMTKIPSTPRGSAPGGGINAPL